MNAIYAARRAISPNTTRNRRYSSSAEEWKLVVRRRLGELQRKIDHEREMLEMKVEHAEWSQKHAEKHSKEMLRICNLGWFTIAATLWINNLYIQSKHGLEKEEASRGKASDSATNASWGSDGVDQE